MNETSPPSSQDSSSRSVSSREGKMDRSFVLKEGGKSENESSRIENFEEEVGGRESLEVG